MRNIHFVKQLLILLIILPGTHLSVTAQIKVACIGNSITYGAGIDNRETFSYPAQLQLILGAQWEVRNFGVSGRTMLKKGNQPIWKEKAFADALAFQPDVVIIKLGTNDSKGVNWQYKDEFAGDYQSMIDTLERVSNPIIYLCRPVPAFGNNWDIDSLAIADEIIPTVNQLASKNNHHVIDLFGPFQDKKVLFPDLIHPSGHGASLMAGIITKHLMKDYALIMEHKIKNSINKNEK